MINDDVRTECGLAQFPPKPVPQLSPAQAGLRAVLALVITCYGDSEPVESTETHTKNVK